MNRCGVALVRGFFGGGVWGFGFLGFFFFFVCLGFFCFSQKLVILNDLQEILVVLQLFKRLPVYAIILMHLFLSSHSFYFSWFNKSVAIK